MSTISIIGTGGMAAAIGGLAAKAGYPVQLMGRDAEKAQALIKRLAPAATTERSALPRPGTSSSWRFPTPPFSTC